MPDIPCAEGSKCTRNNAPGMRLFRGLKTITEPSPLAHRLLLRHLPGTEAADDSGKALVGRLIRGYQAGRTVLSTERADDGTRMLNCAPDSSTRNRVIAGKLDAPFARPRGTARGA